MDIFTSTVAGVFQFRGPGGTRTVGKAGLGKVITYRGSPLVCVIRDKTRVCLDILGVDPACTQACPGVLGAFLHCDNL